MLRNGPNVKCQLFLTADTVAMTSCGIIYSASGEHYVREAESSLRSSLAHNQCLHALFCDPVPENPLDGVDYVPFTRSANPFADNVSSWLATPFERTLFLDTDVHVVDCVTGLFDVLDRFDIAIAHAPGYRGLADPEVPAAFFEFNAGVIAYRRSEAMMSLFAEVCRTYLAWRADPPEFFRGHLELEFQPVLRRCLWNSSLRICTLGPEYNYRSPKPGFATDNVRIVHGRHPDIGGVANVINGRQEPRVFDGFPLAEGHWQHKTRWRVGE